MLAERSPTMGASSSFRQSSISTTMVPNSTPPTSAPSSSTTSSTASSSSRQRPRVSPNNDAAASFHLGNLPRFHPAVYQSNGNSHQPPPPVQQQQQQQRPSQTYRIPSSGGSRDSMRQYRELVAGLTQVSRASSTSSATSSTSYTKPSKPRLDPLGSPGPVTPLALEDEQDGYLGTKSSSDAQLKTGHDGGTTVNDPQADLVDRLIQRENERFASHNTLRKENKGR